MLPHLKTIKEMEQKLYLYNTRKETIMNIETTKLELMHLLLQTQKESLLAKLKKVFDEEQVDWWSEMSKEEQEEIKTGLKQADKSEYIANETVMKRFDKWH